MSRSWRLRRGHRRGCCARARQRTCVGALATRIATAIPPYRPLFTEQPTLRENPEGRGELAARSPVPIATSVGLFSRFEFKQLQDAKGAAIIRSRGRVTELRKIAHLARAYGVEEAPHRCNVGLPQFPDPRVRGSGQDLFLEITEGTYPTQKGRPGRAAPGRPI